MLAYIIFSVIFEAVLFYFFVDMVKTKNRYKKVSNDLAWDLAVSTELRMQDARDICDLTWERDASQFMLETVLDELPSDHMLTRRRNPNIKLTFNANRFANGMMAAERITQIMDENPGMK